MYGRSKSAERKIIAFLLMIMLLAAMTVPAAATDSSRSYRLEVLVDGSSEAVIQKGGSAAAQVRLSQLVPDGDMTIYAFSATIRVCTSLLEISDLQALSGVSKTVTTLSGSLDGWSDITLNFLSSKLSGTTWDNPVTLLTFNLEGTANRASLIMIRRCSVSTYSGMDSFECETAGASVSVNSPAPPDSGTDPSEDDPPEPTDSVDKTALTQSIAAAEDDLMTVTASADGSELWVTQQWVPSDDAAALRAAVDAAQSVVEQEDAVQSEVDAAAAALEEAVNIFDNAKRAGLKSFSDVEENDWFYQSVYYTAEKGFFQGTGPDIFSPREKMTRAMFIAVLGRIAGVDTAMYSESVFPDVPAGTWCSAYVQWGRENGIVLGYDDGNYGPQDVITREQMAAIMYRYAVFSGWSGEIEAGEEYAAFPDRDQVSAYAKEAMIWATSTGLIRGTDQGLEPQKTATRAEVATIIMRWDMLIG